MSRRPPPGDDPRLPATAFAVVGIALAALVIVGFLEEERRAWRAHQERYRELEQTRAVTPEQRRAAETIPIRLRQIVVPELGAVDRCVSCHVAVDDPTYAGREQPFAYHPDHDLHSFERFGCTVCHLGQGRATEARDAHGDVPFWDRPMLPLAYIEASCGRCHEPANNPAAPRLAEGARLFEDSGCRGCHRLGGFGNPIGPDIDADRSGPLRRPEWLVEHFLDPRRAVPASPMPAFGFSREEAESLALFVLSRQLQPVSGYHASRWLLESAEAGAQLFRVKGCSGCHSLGGRGGDTGPPLDDVVTRRTEHWLVEHFRDPQSVSPGTVMPQFGFSRDEAHSLVLFLRRLHERGIEAPGGSFQPTPAQRGERIYRRYGCRGCHGADGEGGVTNRNAESGEQVPPLRFVREGYTAEELKQRIRLGVRDVARLDPEGPEPPLFMPAWGDRLSEGQLDDLVAYLFSLYPEGEELAW